MSLRRAALVLTALAMAGAAPAARPPRATPAKTNWLATVTRTADGAYVLGNPAARVRLVEYMSYTCTHCAVFDAEGGPALRAGYIATGKVSLELRHALRDRFDTVAALLARCEPGRFFAVSHAILAQQPAWLARASMLAPPPSSPDASQAALLLPVARGAGLDAIAAANGVPPARQAACLGAKPELDRLGRMRFEAWTTRNIQGTPAFFIGGVDQQASDWATLQPKLDAALR